MPAWGMGIIITPAAESSRWNGPVSMPKAWRMMSFSSEIPVPKPPGAEAADRARGHLEDPRARAPDPELGMDRPVHQPESPGRPSGGLEDPRLHLGLQAGGGDIDGLLEV